MRCWRKRAELAALLLGVSLLCGCGAEADRSRLAVVELQLEQQQDSVILTPQLELRLSGAVLEALNNGVPVVVLLEARLEHERSWIWPTTLAAKERHFELTYHSLSNQYLVRWEDEVPHAYPSREAALKAMETPEPLRLEMEGTAEGEGTLTAAVRVRLELDALPAPLRLVALFSPGWRIGSEWRREALPP